MVGNALVDLPEIPVRCSKLTAENLAVHERKLTPAKTNEDRHCCQHPAGILSTYEITPGEMRKLLIRSWWRAIVNKQMRKLLIRSWWIAIVKKLMRKLSWWRAIVNKLIRLDEFDRVCIRAAQIFRRAS